MSSDDRKSWADGLDISQPLSQAEVRRLTKWMLENQGEVSWTTHARRELAKDDMTIVDATNVIRCWLYMDPAEQDMTTGDWKYRIHTDFMGIVVKFRSVKQLVVITSWRK
jgi:hypothetical protein